MRNFKEEIEHLKKGIARRFHPKAIVVFGSCASGTATERSDIDLCVIIETNNKRKLNGEMSEYIYAEDGLDFDQPVDLLIYTPEEWNKHVKTPGTFANLIEKKGEMIYG